MRLSVRSLRRVVKGDLSIAFVPQDLTSCGGLKLVGSGAPRPPTLPESGDRSARRPG